MQTEKVETKIVKPSDTVGKKTDNKASQKALKQQIEQVTAIKFCFWTTEKHADTKDHE